MALLQIKDLSVKGLFLSSRGATEGWEEKYSLCDVYCILLIDELCLIKKETNFGGRNLGFGVNHVYRYLLMLYLVCLSGFLCENV